MQLDVIFTLTGSAFFLVLGALIVRHVGFFKHFAIPAPVVGGVLGALTLFLCVRAGFARESLNLSLQPLLMSMFFAVIGFEASIESIKQGGKHFFMLLALLAIFMLIQNLAGAGAATLLGLPPLVGVLGGSVSLAGGPGTAAAFAPLFEAAGVHSPEVIGVTFAVCGIVLGGILGSPFAARLIEKNSLSADHTVTHEKPSAHSEEHRGGNLIGQILLLVLVAGSGALSCQLLKQWTGITLPLYLGGMIVAAIIRNIADARKFSLIEMSAQNALGGASLGLFLTTAIAVADFSGLATLALPLVTLLAVQVCVSLLLTYIIFRILGRTYDSAFMTAGIIGFMLGTMANALSNLQALSTRYTPSPRATLLVTLTGAGFIDLINAGMIITLIKLF